MIDGELQRFCRQHNRFHPIKDFDGDKRTCRDGCVAHANACRASRKRMGAATAATNEVDGDDNDGEEVNDDDGPAITTSRQRAMSHKRALTSSRSDSPAVVNPPPRAPAITATAAASQRQPLSRAGSTAAAAVGSLRAADAVAQPLQLQLPPPPLPLLHVEDVQTSEESDLVAVARRNLIGSGRSLLRSPAAGVAPGASPSAQVLSTPFGGGGGDGGGSGGGGGRGDGRLFGLRGGSSQHCDQLPPPIRAAAPKESGVSSLRHLGSNPALQVAPLVAPHGQSSIQLGGQSHAAAPQNQQAPEQHGPGAVSGLVAVLTTAATASAGAAADGLDELMTQVVVHNGE